MVGHVPYMFYPSNGENRRRRGVEEACRRRPHQGNSMTSVRDQHLIWANSLLKEFDLPAVATPNEALANFRCLASERRDEIEELRMAEFDAGIVLEMTKAERDECTFVVDLLDWALGEEPIPQDAVIRWQP